MHGGKILMFVSETQILQYHLLPTIFSLVAEGMAIVFFSIVKITF
jgi:hypothetical protein